MELKKLIYTVNEDGIAVITMNYMKNLNAIDEQMADELMYVVDAAEKDPNVKVVVLKGTDRAFSAGGDIGYFYELIQAGGEVNMDGLISKVGVVADGLKRMSKMVITSVCGAAAGAGVSLALGGDFMICADNAKFILAFVNIGLVPDTGATYSSDEKPRYRPHNGAGCYWSPSQCRGSKRTRIGLQGCCQRRVG